MAASNKRLRWRSRAGLAGLNPSVRDRQLHWIGSREAPRSRAASRATTRADAQAVSAAAPTFSPNEIFLAKHGSAAHRPADGTSDC